MCERVFRGNIVFASKFGEYEIIENGFIVVSNNIIVGVYSELPEMYSEARIFDYGDKLIIPGFTDLDLKSKENSEYSDREFAIASYTELVRSARENGTTRAVIDGTIYIESNMVLMDLVSKAGLGAFVSKTSVDQNSPRDYIEDLKRSKSNAEEFFIMTSNKHEIVKPLATIDLGSQCSRELRSELINMTKRFGAKLKLDSNWKSKDEITDCLNSLESDSIAVVNIEPKLISEIESISGKSLSISCSAEQDIDSLDIENGLKSGINFGLSSSNTSILETISRLKDRGLSFPELFYMATKGGGAFFGKIGSFETGYEFDALIIDDSKLENAEKMSIEERLERCFKTGGKGQITDIYVSGQKSLGL